MIKKQVMKILLVTIILIFAMQLNVYAGVITSTDKSVESGSGNVTISVTAKQSLGAYTLKVSDTAGLELVGASGGEISADKRTITGSSATGTTSLGTYTFKVPTVSNDTTYRIKFNISGMETTSLDGIADQSNTAVLTVKAKQVTPPPATTQQDKTSTTTTPEKKSSDANLTNLGINPNDFKGFKSSKTEYSVEVPNSVKSVKVYATPAKGATVEGTGNVELKEGDNTVKVKVTAEDGKTTKTYTLTIKRKTAEEEAANAGEARLKNLGIKPEEYDFSGFDNEKTEYSVNVPNNIEEIEVYATAMNSKAQITGTGMITLKEGLNELNVEVIAEDGTKKVYILKVTREESSEVEGTTINEFGLSTLLIQGLSLNPSFKVGIYEYTVELNEDLTSLDIDAKANDENATIEIIGNEELQEGENIVKILVRNSETEEIVTYEIIVNKNLQQETIQTSWLKPATWGKEEKIKISIIIVLIILIISAIILKIKIGKEVIENKDRDLPGADELDKAITEHQELSEETIEGVANENYIQDIAASRFDIQDDSTDLESRPKRKGRHF